jgi:hypothetical protein
MYVRVFGNLMAKEGEGFEKEFNDIWNWLQQFKQ